MKLKHLVVPFTVMLLAGCGAKTPETPSEPKTEVQLTSPETFLELNKDDVVPRVGVKDFNIEVKNYSLTSSDPSVISVVNNKLHAVKEGSATITITAPEDDEYIYKTGEFNAKVFTSLERLDIDPFNRTYTKLESTKAYVRKVENLNDQDFIMGMDISSVLAEEAAGVKYYDFNGEEADVFKVLSDNGINYIRVRVWNDPKDANGNYYGGGNNDLAHAIEIGKRATKYNMSLLVDFHYSDFWADPSRQTAPKAWKNMDLGEKVEALETFTKESLEAMKAEGIKVGMVQIGNETNGGAIAGESVWTDTVKLFNAGSKAVRDVYKDDDFKPLVALHFANPEKTDNYLDWAYRVRNVDYDVFGTSYYPYWHGTLDNLSYALSFIAAKYNKRTMVMETSYVWQCDANSDFDFGGNQIGYDAENDKELGFEQKDYPFTVHGQINHLVNLVDTIRNKTVNGIGVCYWEGAWIPAPGLTKEGWQTNQAIWNQYGCGWASDYAKGYDKAVTSVGGTQVDNQTFFDKDGHPLESLKAWNLMRFGNTIDKFVDGLEQVEMTKLDTDTFTLPDTVNAVYCDNSKAPIPVTWEDFDVEEAKKQGNKVHIIRGTAGGLKAICRLQIMEYNFVQNYSFDTGSYKNWRMTTSDKLTATHIIKVTSENPRSGKFAAHFWTSDAEGLSFTLEQDIKGLEAGKYKLTFNLLGGGTGPDDTATPAKQDVYIYVKKGGSIVKKLDVKFANWNTKYVEHVLKGIEVSGDITIGINVTIRESGCWGDIDDVMFNKDNG